MPSDDDFADYENTAPEADALTADEVALLAKFRAEKRDDDYTTPASRRITPTWSRPPSTRKTSTRTMKWPLPRRPFGSRAGAARRATASSAAPEAKSAGKIPANAPQAAGSPEGERRQEVRGIRLDDRSHPVGRRDPRQPVRSHRLLGTGSSAPSARTRSTWSRACSATSSSSGSALARRLKARRRWMRLPRS